MNDLIIWFYVNIFRLRQHSSRAARFAALPLPPILKDISKKTFKEWSEIQNFMNRLKRNSLLEYEIYKQVPGKSVYFRIDPGNTNTNTQKHAHVYAKKGKQIYSVNFDGSGHDGSSGIEIPKSQADFFRDKGFQINPDNVLESESIKAINESFSQFSLIILIND